MKIQYHVSINEEIVKCNAKNTESCPRARDGKDDFSKKHWESYDIAANELESYFTTKHSLTKQLRKSTSIPLRIKEVMNMSDNSVKVFIKNLKDKKLLNELSYSQSKVIRQSVANNQNTPSSTLDTMSNSLDEYVVQAIARNKNTDKETLHKLSKSDNIITRINVAENKNTHQNTLHILSRDKDYGVQTSVALNTKTNSKTLEEMSYHYDTRVKTYVARNRKTPYKTLMRLSKDSSEKVKTAVNETLRKKTIGF